MKRKSLATLVGGLLAIVFMVFGLTAGAASASTTQDCTTMTVDSITATVCSQSTATATASIRYRYIGTWDLASKSLIRHVDGHADCFWAYGTWTNSVKLPVVTPYQETSRAKFCWLKHPTTINGTTYTALKVGGGLTNSPCYNWAIPPGQPQPTPKIKGPVLDVKTMTNIWIWALVHAHATSTVTATWECPGGTLQASAGGEGTANGRIKVRIDQRLLLKSGGKVNDAIKASIKQQIRLSIEAKATANAFSKITVSCGSGPPPSGPAVKITGSTTLNDIPEGKNSGPFYYEIDSSVAQQDGFTVDPGTGGVSDCNSSTPTTHGSLSFNLNAGHTEVCVIFYAPTDASANSMTVTATATVHDNGKTAQDQKVQTFPISHPEGP